MVVLNRDPGNKNFLISAFISSFVQMANLPPNVAIDINVMT